MSPRSATPAPEPTVADEIELVVRREHADPHHVLGAHQLDGDVVVRRPVDRDHGDMAGFRDRDVFAKFRLHRLVPRRLRATTHLWTSVGPS